jgi:CDP-diacylglycerol---serine O-phosphatidyltransferase
MAASASDICQRIWQSSGQILFSKKQEVTIDTPTGFSNRRGTDRGADRPSDNPLRRRRLRMRPGMHIYILPNLITTMNLFFGFLAIIQAIKGEFVFAAYAIVAAAIFDTLDGRVARMTQSMSKFGAEYDSLCDLVSFGCAPAVLLYLWALQPFGRIGWLAAFLFTACGALRLARFNVQANIIEKAYFQGLPIPMAAGIVASSVLAFKDLELDPLGNIGLLGMTILLAFVMVSTFRYRSFKDFDLKHRLPFRYVVIGVGLIIVVAIRPEVMLFAVFMLYAVLGFVFGLLRLGKQPKIAVSDAPIPLSNEGDDLHEEVDDDEEPLK